MIPPLKKKNINIFNFHHNKSCQLCTEFSNTGLKVICQTALSTTRMLKKVATCCFPVSLKALVLPWDKAHSSASVNYPHQGVLVMCCPLYPFQCTQNKSICQISTVMSFENEMLKGHPLLRNVCLSVPRYSRHLVQPPTDTAMCHMRTSFLRDAFPQH